VPRSTFFRCVVFVLALAGAMSPAAKAAPADDVTAVFNRFVAAQNAHDVKAVSDLLWDSPNFLWVTRGTAVYGRDEALKRFTALYAGTWSLAPVAGELRVAMLAADTAQIYVPIDFTMGAAGATPAVSRFLMNQTLVRTARGWVVASILPSPVPPAAPAPRPT